MWRMPELNDPVMIAVIVLGVIFCAWYGMTFE